MMFLWFILLVAAVVVVWFLMRDQHGKLPWENKPEEPMEVLKRKYAEGEISKEEYEEKKRILEGEKW
jgi:putative membrane protein